MGKCLSRGAEDKRNTKINKEQKKRRNMEASKLKLLLLGAGESGKSTLFKQMRLLYSMDKKFNDEDKKKFKNAIYLNIFSDMMQICYQITERENGFASQEAQEAAINFMETFQELKRRFRQEMKKSRATRRAIVDEAIANEISLIWNDKATVDLWGRRGILQVQDSLEYFMDPENLGRLAQPTYAPTNGDILRTRIKTAGLVIEEFLIGGARLEMYDVGGQQSERQKWRQYFDGITGVIFVAAISEYDQYMYEDHSTPRQKDAIDLFNEQLHIETWKNTPFLLFLNKTDLFKKKLLTVPFKVASGSDARNVDFQGPHIDIHKEYAVDGTDKEFKACYRAACTYIRDLYESQNNNNFERKASIYTKFTNSTDTNLMRHIMDSCKDIILKGNLLLGGWIGSKAHYEDDLEL